MTDPLSPSVVLGMQHGMIRGGRYQEVGDAFGASKSSAFNAWKDLVAGRTPYLIDVAELGSLLYEVAVEINENSLTLEFVSLGLHAIRSLGNIGLTPASLERFISMAKRLAENEGEASTVMRAAMSLYRLEASTGLAYPELETRGAELEQKCADLEQQIATKQGVLKELASTEKILEVRKKEAQNLEAQNSNRLQEIDIKNRHLEKIAEQTQALEARTHAEVTRMAATRQAEERAAAMGLTAEQLPKLVKRLEPLVLQHQGPIEEVIDRLVADLEEAGSGAALKARRIAGQKIYKKLQEDMSHAGARKSALEAEITELEITRGQLTSRISVMQEQAIPRLNEAAAQVLDLVKKAGETLVETQSELVNKTISLGWTVADLEKTVHTMAWLGTLHQVVSGDGTPTHATVKMTIMVILKGFYRWLRANQGEFPSSTLFDINKLLDTLNKWKVVESDA